MASNHMPIGLMPPMSAISLIVSSAADVTAAASLACYDYKRQYNTFSRPMIARPDSIAGQDTAQQWLSVQQSGRSCEGSLSRAHRDWWHKL